MKRAALAIAVMALVVLPSTSQEVSEPEADEKPQATEIDQLSIKARRQLRDLSQTAFSISGTIYLQPNEKTKRVVERRTRKRFAGEAWTYREDIERRSGRQGYFSPYDRLDAPNVVNIATGQTFQTQEQVEEAAMLVAFDLAIEALGEDSGSSKIITARVNQVLTDGLLIDLNDETTFVAMLDTSHYVDDSVYQGVAVQDGRYEYLTVLGAAKTIRKYREITIEGYTQPEVIPVTDEQIFRYLIKNDIATIRQFHPKGIVLKQPTYTTTKNGSGLNVRRSRRLTDQGEYTYEWEPITIEIDLSPRR